LAQAYGYHLWRPSPPPSTERGRSGADGRFQFRVPKAEFRNQVVVGALASNYGPDWVKVSLDDKRNALELRLVNDDVPITGEIVDLEGRPVAGATLTVMQIN